MSDICRTPPAGWTCTRVAGHGGPCAAWPTKDIVLVPRKLLLKCMKALDLSLMHDEWKQVVDLLNPSKDTE